MRRIIVAVVALIFLTGCGTEEPYDLSMENIEETTNVICYDIGIRVSGTPEEEKTANYLTQQLEALGYTQASHTLYTQKFEALGNESSNIIAVHHPDESLPLISIVAHYDSVPTSMGAGDNAVANGILLEIARYYAECVDLQNAEIRMVFLGSEENGYHGSHYYVDMLSTTDRARHIAAYNLDISAAQLDDEAYLVCNTLGGYVNGAYQEGNFLDVTENVVSNSIAAAYESLYQTSYAGTFHMGESDHVSFHNEELEAGNVCWRQIESGFTILPSEYHCDTDTPDKLDYQTACATGRTVLCAVDWLLENMS